MMNDLAQFDKLKADITLHVKPLLAVTVTDVETQKLAYDSGKQVKTFQKMIEEKRKELVGPLNARVKEINDYAKQISSPLDNAENHIKSELRKFEIELEKIRQAELKKAEEERLKREAEALAAANKAKEEAELSAMLMSDDDAEREKLVAQAGADRAQAQLEKDHARQTKEIESMKVSGSKKVWTFKVNDLSQVPREYLVLDEKKVRESIRSGVREISGIEIYQETSIAIR